MTGLDGRKLMGEIYHTMPNLCKDLVFPKKWNNAFSLQQP
jgi:hypothetical protein